MGYHLGVDLGTTFTAAAITRGDRVEIASLGNRSTAVPSVLWIGDDGDVLVGEAAERRGVSDPSRVAREFKRRLGDTTPILLGGTPYSAEVLSSRLLTWVVGAVARGEGARPDHVAVTHPANWGGYKKDLLAQAVRLADLDTATTLTEPEAAAIYYASQERVDDGGVIAVYDLGGGTFDAAVIRRDGDAAFTILGRPEGIERLGGIDFDGAVFGHVTSMVAEEIDRLDPDDPAARAAVARLKEDCIAAKECLSSDTDVSIPVLLPNVSTEVRLTRAEFEDMLRPRLEDTVGAMRRALAGAQVEAKDVRAVLLVGGSSRIPMVAQMVSAGLGRPVAVDAHPKNAIALGAAIAAAAAVGAPTPQPQPQPIADLPVQPAREALPTPVAAAVVAAPVEAPAAPAPAPTGPAPVPVPAAVATAPAGAVSAAAGATATPVAGSGATAAAVAAAGTTTAVADAPTAATAAPYPDDAVTTAPLSPAPPEPPASPESPASPGSPVPPESTAPPQPPAPPAPPVRPVRAARLATVLPALLGAVILGLGVWFLFIHKSGSARPQSGPGPTSPATSAPHTAPPHTAPPRSDLVTPGGAVLGKAADVQPIAAGSDNPCDALVVATAGMPDGSTPPGNATCATATWNQHPVAFLTSPDPSGGYLARALVYDGTGWQTVLQSSSHDGWAAAAVTGRDLTGNGEDEGVFAFEGPDGRTSVDIVTSNHDGAPFVIAHVSAVTTATITFTDGHLEVYDDQGATGRWRRQDIAWGSDGHFHYHFAPVSGPPPSGDLTPTG